MKFKKFAILFMCALFSGGVFGQINTGQVGLETGPILNGGENGEGEAMGVLSINVTVDQNLEDLDDHRLRELKISALKFFFEEHNGWRGNLEAFSYIRSETRFTEEDAYFLEQLQLLRGEVSKVVKLPQGFQLTISAYVGVGGSINVDHDNMILSVEELEAVKEAYDCPRCVREGVRTSGSLPIERGVSVTINRGKSYIKLAYDYQKSGMYRRLLDEDGEQYHYGYKYVFDWERRKTRQLSAEIGREFNVAENVPMTVYGRATHNRYTAISKLASQGDGNFYDTQQVIERDPIDLMNFQVGVKVQLFNNFGKRKK